MDTIIRAVVTYWVLLFVLRVVGRRAVNKMTPFELILIFLFGGLTVPSIVSDDRSLTNALLAVMTVGLMHVLVSWLKQWSGLFGRVVDGTPVVVVEHGELHDDRLRKLQIQPQDVMASARAQGVERMEQIRFAVVERNGSIAIIRRDEEETGELDKAA